MWPRVCGHGLAFARNTALPDLVAYGDARRTGPRLRCRRAAESAPAQRCEPGMPTSDTHRPPLRSSHAAVWAPSEGCESVAVCRRVEFAPDVQKRQGLAIPRPKAVLSSRAPHAYTRAHTPAHARTFTRAYACMHTRTHARARAHTHARTHARAHARKIVRTPTSATIPAPHTRMLKLTLLKRYSPRLRTMAHKPARVCAGRGGAGRGGG